ncbi:MAG TPA: GspH/FimT family pseudopilin [Nitrospiraceae bacterium]|jgi:prepilin-type N-terminal cleavage/methylation domain-containing protein|nr:GspH/FimT family pseudopilin [Nitrospiraceae bacterium]
MKESTRLGQGAGFTLIEVTVVVAILGILVVISIPNYLDWNRKAKLKDAVGLVSGDINLARMNAINRNKSVTVTVTQPAVSSPVTVTFQVGGVNVVPPLTLDTEVSLTNAANAVVGSGVNSPQDVLFTPMGLRNDTGNANNLCIDGVGVYTGAPCTNSSTQAFNFNNTVGLNYRIVVTSAGKVSWCYTNNCAQ